MGSKCCKRISGQLGGKAENALIDYRGRPINLERDFAVISDTSSEDEDLDETDPSENAPLVPPPPPKDAIPTSYPVNVQVAEPTYDVPLSPTNVLERDARHGRRGKGGTKRKLKALT
ncbi:B99 [miniopterid betaherpesvirus 1]|uniref:Cytoplasmic envelopment protein 3 n=1 Tax=miniopterid betaherpesvirus 1 TaxID=3070189 RepID=I3VQ92_9BETA|nr:B99 [miniopterid betaherpesvirus 1]AFK83936.1 B99 [miniopterid betaherpesvirus 1]